jgi:hypothetical protein
MHSVLLGMAVENAKVTELHCICKQPDDGRYHYILLRFANISMYLFSNELVLLRFEFPFLIFLQIYDLL